MIGDGDINSIFVCLTDIRHVKILFDYAKCVLYT